MNCQIRTSFSMLALLLCATPASLGTEISILGETASIGNGFTDTGVHPEGSHFHTSNLVPGDLPPGNPPLIPVDQVAEVGGFFGDEEVRGVSEFNLVGQPVATSATVVFDVFDLTSAGLNVTPLGGLFGQEVLDGSVNVFAYRGNNVEEVSDYAGNLIQTDPLLTLDVASLSAGQTISIPVTDIYNDLIADLADNPETAAQALGIRLQTTSNLPDSLSEGAIAFHNFRLQVVPEPNCLPLLWLALWPLVRRHR